MKDLQSLVAAIISLEEKNRTRDDVLKIKRKRSKENKLEKVPTNLQVLKTYYSMITTGVVERVDWIESLLKKRSIRSESGIVAVQVLTKPFWCPGKCIFCPNDATMPKSYINTQPGAMRALLNQFDPYKQVYNRLLSLTLTGHKTDKIEMIVLGGTWDVYPKSYKTEFIKGLYDACNTFTEFLDHIEIDFSSDKSARYTVTEDLNIAYPEKIEDSILRNESAANRIIGLTVETRPEYVTHENCQFWRELGVTRIEMGIQTLHNDVHELNKRGHTNTEIRSAMHMLRQYGFKISNHYMPGLYGSTPEKDAETFHIAFSTPWIKSDELKFYPTAVIPNTPLYDLFEKGEYQPIKDDDLKSIVRLFKSEIVPPYARIKRLARDFDTNEVVAGANTPNLRQLVMNELIDELSKSEEKRECLYKRLSEGSEVCHSFDDFLLKLSQSMPSKSDKYVNLSGEERIRDARVETYTLQGEFDSSAQRNFICLCTRCRECRHLSKTKDDKEIPFLVARRYRSSNGEEIFLSFEDSYGYLYGFTRLLLPDKGQTIDFDGLGHDTALIRELHVYGSLQSLLDKKEKKSGQKTTAQHKGFGTQLMQTAGKIAKERGRNHLSVISGVGVKAYYRKLGFYDEGTYVKNDLR